MDMIPPAVDVAKISEEDISFSFDIDSNLTGICNSFAISITALLVIPCNTSFLGVTKTFLFRKKILKPAPLIYCFFHLPEFQFNVPGHMPQTYH